MCSDKLPRPIASLASFGGHVCPRTHTELRGQLVCFPLSSSKSWDATQAVGLGPEH